MKMYALHYYKIYIIHMYIRNAHRQFYSFTIHTVILEMENKILSNMLHTNPLIPDNILNIHTWKLLFYYYYYCLLTKRINVTSWFYICWLVVDLYYVFFFTLYFPVSHILNTFYEKHITCCCYYIKRRHAIISVTGMALKNLSKYIYWDS